MAGTPNWKVYNPSGEYVAACKHVEDAACLVALYGTGATIRDGHAKADIRWTEGSEEFHAGESYDRVTIVVTNRCRDHAERSAAARGVPKSGSEILAGRS